MCGIAGILSQTTDSSAIDLSRTVGLMTAAQTHRGPDDSGTMSVSLAGRWELHLGHRRLSIQDVSKNGHQPMGDPETGSWVSFNGEIYNHLELRATLSKQSFVSTSDTETLLHGWIEQGPEFVNRLRGCFGFAIYDGRRKQLSLVRDRLGIKPLYWARPEQATLLFASEVRAILASQRVPRHLSQNGLHSYLSFGAVQAPETIVEGIHSVMPGERICIDCQSLTEEFDCVVDPYWQPVFISEESSASQQDGRISSGKSAVELLRPIFDDAVRSRFLADVPVGVFLSGGIDSSAIVASAARQQLQPATFSVSFAEADFDESVHARAVAESCGVEHTTLAITAASMLADLDEALDCYDQPSSDGLNMFTIAKAASEAGLKVAISGLGGDEGFAGYGTFRRLPRIERWQRRLRFMQSRVWTTVVGAIAGHHGRLVRGTEMLTGSRSRLDVYSCLRRFYSDTEIGQLMNSHPLTSTALPADLAAVLSRRASALDAVNAVSLLELSLYMPNMLLRDTDQMSMAHGLEVRVPLLDHLLVDRLATIPGATKLPAEQLTNKWLLVEMVRESLPAAVVDRKKMGFVFPWDRWLRNELHGFVDRHLLDPESVQAAGLVPNEVARVWRSFQAGRGGVRYADVLTLLNLVHWCQVNNVMAPFQVKKA